MDENKIDGVFAELFVKSQEEAEKLKKEYEDSEQREQSQKQKILEKIARGKKPPVFWIVKKQGIIVSYICPVPKGVVELQCRSWIKDLKQVLEEKLKEDKK